MGATTRNEKIPSGSAIASADEIRAAFTEHRQELTWLAEFLTADEAMASACVADARDLSSDNKDDVCQECVQSWPREATIRSALDLKRMRISELSWAYESRALTDQSHPPLSFDRIEFVVRESEAIRQRLDSVCRFVLILYGVEHRSLRAVARMLGISRDAVHAAYNAALEVLEVIYCQTLLEACGCAAA